MTTSRFGSPPAGASALAGTVLVGGLALHHAAQSALGCGSRIASGHAESNLSGWSSSRGTYGGGSHQHRVAGLGLFLEPSTSGVVRGGGEVFAVEVHDVEHRQGQRDRRTPSANSRGRSGDAATTAPPPCGARRPLDRCALDPSIGRAHMVALSVTRTAPSRGVLKRSGSGP